MINKEVIPAFEMLLEELERIIPDLNDQGKKLMDEKKYPDAHAIINKAQAVVAFQEKVKSLREEWLSMEVPATQNLPLVPTKSKASQVPSKSLIKGQRTHEEQFKLPILQTLMELGGRASKNHVLEKLENTIADRLNQVDWEILPSGNNEIRWKNTVAWARQKMIYGGLLVKNSPTGTWEITPAGKEYLQTHKEELPSIETSKTTKKAEDPQKPLQSGSGSEVYDLEYHLKSKPRSMVHLFGSLRSMIFSLSPDVEEIITKVYFSYRIKGKTFAEIHVQKAAIKTWVFVPIKEIKHYLSICRDVSKIGHYGTGPTEIIMTLPSQITFVSDIIQKSYKLILGSVN